MMSFETCDSNLCKELVLRGATKVEQISFPTERGRFREMQHPRFFVSTPNVQMGCQSTAGRKAW